MAYSADDYVNRYYRRNPKVKPSKMSQETLDWLNQELQKKEQEKVQQQLAENGFGAGVASGAASVYSGYTGFLNAAMGEHDTNQKPIGIFGLQDPAAIMTAKQEMKDAQKGFKDLELANAPSRNWTDTDIANDPIGYITEPSGLRYSLGNQVGFMVGTAPLGVTGGMGAKIVLNPLARAGTGSVLGNTLAGRAVNTVGRLANGKTGTGAILGAGQGASEAIVEGGLVYRDLIEQGKSPEEASAIALDVAAKNLPTSAAAGAAMGGVWGRTANRFANPTTGSRVLNASKALVFGAPMAGMPDAAQEIVQEGITGQAKGEKVFDIYSPETWGNPLSEAQRTAAVQALITSGVLGGFPSAVGAGIRRPQPQEKEKPATIKANATSGNEDIDRIILEKSKQYGIDPDLVHAVIWKESRYNPKAVSPVGAVGLMQLMEGTAGDLGVTNREDIEQNIDGGIRYLKQMYEKNGGDWNAQDRETWEKALASYNGGYGRRNLTQTRLYAHDVWNKYNEFRGENADADITAMDVDTDDVSTIDTEDVERNAIEYAKHKIDKSDEDYTFLNDAIRRNDKQAVMDKYSAQDIQDWADYQVLNDQKLNEKYKMNRDANIKKILQNGEIKITNRQMLPFYRQNDTFRGGTIKKVEGGYLYTPPKDFMNRAEVGRIAEENGITEMPVKESPQAQRDEMWGTKNDTLEQQIAKAHKRDEQKQLDEWAKEYEAEEARVNQWVADEEAREQAEAQEKQALTQRMADTLNNLIATGREDTARRLLQVLNSPQVTDNAIANDEELARQMAEGRAQADQERRKEKYRVYQAEKEAKAREGLNQRLTNAIAGILENERNDLAGQMAEGRENAVQERQAREDLSQRLANAVAGILENERTTLANQMAEGREQAEKQRKQEAEANAPAEEVTAEPKQEKTEEKTGETVPKTETVEETPKETVEESSDTEPQETVPEKENIAEEKESESEEKKDSLSSAKPKKGRWWRKEYPDKKTKSEFMLEKSEVTEESATILDAVSEDEEYLSRLTEEERASLADLKKQFGEDWLSGMREVRDETAKQYKALIEKYAKMMLDRVLTNKNDAWIKKYREWYFRLLNEGKTKQERLGIMLEGLRKEATYQLRNRPIDAKLGKPLIGEESCTKFAELEAVLDGYAYIQVEADKYHKLQSKGKTSVNIAETDIQGETENAKTQQRTSGRSEKKGERNNRVRDFKSKFPQREVKYTFVMDAADQSHVDLKNALPKQSYVDQSFQKYMDGHYEVKFYNTLQKKDYNAITALGFKPKDEKSKFDKATAEQFPRIDTHNERLEEFYKNVRDWCKKQGTGTLAKIVGESKEKWFATDGDTNHSPTGFLDFCNQAVLKNYKLPQKWVKLYKDTRKGREEMYEAFEDIGKATPQEADTIEFNLETDDATSREYRHDVMKKNGFTENAIAELDKRIKRVAKIVKEVSDLHKDFDDWQRVVTDRLQEDGILVPKVNAFIKNGEYQLNMDLGTLCIKREGVDAAIQVLIDMDDVGVQNLGASQIWQICDVLKRNGYLVPCEVCFVESKRVRALDTANAISLHWKAVLDALGIDDGKKIGKPRTLTAEQQEKLDRMARTSQKDKDIREAAYDELIADKYKREYDVKVSKDGKETKTALDNGLTPDKMARIASLMKQDSRLIGEFDAKNIMTSANTDKLLNEYHHTDLPGFLASADGAATAKPLQGRHVYDGLSFKTVYDNTKKTVAYVFDIGGVRLQSFSDFDVMLFFDYVQFIADLEARNLPAHTYTKIPEFVELFKKTGIKTNMSLLYGISEEVDANGNKPPAGLQFAKDENGNIKYDRKGNPKYDYLYVDESFGAKQGVSGEEGAKRAFALRDKEGNVGTIGVGLSDEHIEKMLADDRIDMVIPYHASGMPKGIQIRSGLYKAIDYSKQQNTKKKKKEKAVDKEGQTNDDAVEKEYPFNKKLREIGDPRKTAEDYLAWCEKNGYTPKFPQFAKNDNYYKLLADFRVYDGKGDYAPQKSVQLKLPRNIKSLLKARVAERVSNVEQVKNIAQNEALVKELKDTVTKYERIDNLTLEEMKKRLNSVLKTGKGDAVVSLRSEQFFNELDRLAEAGKGVTKEQVEVLRTSNKVVYGFAVGGKIYLNENYTNANTPAHEFTHIWAKVVKANNPKLWKQGVNLLKTDPRSKKIWDEVVNDPNYESIRDNEDAVASEVLARIVGGENEKLVKEIFNNANGKRATHTKSFGEKLMDWIKSFFGNVIDILGLDRDVKYDEFVNAPLGAIWDEQAGKSFNAALKKWQKMKENGSVEFQAAGINAMTANKNALREAMRMRKAGENKEAIYDKTGWHLGADGKWRFEIPDILRKIDFDELIEDAGYEVTLDDIYDNPALYEAYPWLRGVSVETEDMGEKRRGATYINQNRIAINKQYLMDGNINDVKKTLIHEIQHLIQNREGFAMGGSASIVREQIKQQIERHKEDAKRIHPKAIGFLIALNDAANAREYADKKTFEEKRKKLAVYEAEIPHKDQEKIFELSQKWKQLYQSANDSRSAIQKYFDLHGEQEARATANRAGMNPKSKEYRGSMLGGINEDTAIIVFGNSPVGALSAEEYDSDVSENAEVHVGGANNTAPTKNPSGWLKRKFGKTKNLTHELRVKDAITNLTGLKVAWGHTDKDIIYDEKQGVIRTRTAQDWGRVVPQVAEIVAKRLGMGIKTVDGKKTVDPAMRDYITEYIFTGALTKANTKEAKEFERVMQKNPKESEDILALKCEFERYGALTLSEQAMENLETDVKQNRTLKQKAIWTMMKLVDKYYPVRLMSMKMYKKFKELGEEMPRYLNPNTIVKNVSGATAQASMLIHLPQKRLSANATENKKLIMESIEATKDMIRREFPSVDESLIRKFKPLELILQEAGMYGDDTEAKKFQTYMVARRMLELHDREGIEEFPEVYNTPEKCEQIIAELETPEYIQAAEDLYNLQTLSLAIQVDCGTLSQTYFDRVTNENKNYIPLRRLIDDEKMTRNADSTKKVEGSARVVWAPFDQAMDNIAKGFVKAQKNKAMAQVGQAAKLLGQAKTIEVVENNQPNSRNVVSYLVNGERVYIEAYPELAMSLAHITEARAATGAIKILSMANRVPRELLTTNNPEFALSAFFRDAMNFFLYEKGDPVDLFKGLKHTLLRDSVFQEYMTSGASQSVLTAADKDYFARNVTGSDKGSLSGFKNVIKALDKITSAPTEIMEQAVRVAAYEKTKNRVMKEELDNLEAKLRKSGMTEAQIQRAIQQYGMKDAIMTATVEARLTARDLMDFASRGEWGDALNSYSWFANAVIQGGYKSVRALNWKDPANKGKIQGRLLRLAGVCILQAALSAMGEDDDEIKGLSDSDRYMYFHVRVGDSVLRIPKGDDLGIRTLTFWIDMMFNKREATLKRAMLPLENAFPNLLFMSALKPVVEVLANYSFFYNSEIVPKRLQNPALPEREHDAFTSRLAKEIGIAFHWSPKKVDYMMNAYFGGLGRLGRGAIDWAAEGKAPKETAVVRRFVVPKGKTSVFVNDAYEYISEQDALYKDWQERRKTDSRAKADERFDKAKYTRLKYDKKKLKELTEKIRQNRENPRITEAQREANHIAFTKARNKLAESIMFR